MTGNDDERFLQAILADPEDAALRLVYADWLEERGDPRGEYLRCQCARAKLRPGPEQIPLLRREEELRRRHPAVILPWQRRLTLGRIRDLLGRSVPEPYVPNPCLTEEELLHWEDFYGFALPEEYRLFLLEVGDGGEMPCHYCDFVVEPLAETVGRPKMPFPVTLDRFQARFRQLETEPRPADGDLFPELTPYWEEFEPPGGLVFGRCPSGDSLFLVTAGDLRGSVWCCVGGSGVPEVDWAGVPRGFLAWFAGVLAELTDVLG